MGETLDEKEDPKIPFSKIPGQFGEKQFNSLHRSTSLGTFQQGNRFDSSTKLNVDGVVTNLKNIGLSILTADCAPIFFLDLNNDIIAACHAGWRGALNGIIENTINKMIEIGSLRKNILAIIGPTIQQHSYEIGNDLAIKIKCTTCLLYTSPSPRDQRGSGMPSCA